MRPRQNLRDFHHNTPPPTSQPPTYQSVNHSVALQPPLQSMAPPPLLPSPMSAGSQAGQSSQPPTLPMPDLFAELSRLGLNPEDMNNQSFNRPHLPDEVLKNLQAILGKRDSADLLRKLLPSHNDPSNTSAPDYQRLIGGNSGTSSGGNMDNILSGTILSGTGGCTGGALSFTNNINNGNSSQQQEQQDVQYASAQQQQHQAAASTVNHHQHFRIPTTNTAMHNSPLQQQQQQQQLLSQHKSVLSLHHPQQHLTHPHQNDPANRQRLNQQHKLNSAPNSSIANLNDMSGGPSSSSLSSSNAALLDTKNSNIFNHRTSPAINSYTIPSAGTTSRVPNIMDALGGQPGLDNMNDNMPFQQAITMNNRDKLKSLAKHQQLQKQFRTTADKHKNLQWPNQNVSSANLNLGSDPHNQQRIIGSNINNNSNANNISMSQLQRQMNSPLSSAISPPQASPGLPKSLLNLAACSTSPPNAGNVNSLASNSRISNQLSNVRGSNVNIGNNVNSTNNRQIVRNNTNSVGQRATSSADPNNILQQIMTRPSNNKNPGSNSATRSGYSNFSLSSLLSDDQSSNLKDNNNSTNNNNNNRSVVNQNTVPILRPNSQGSQPVQRRPSSAKSDDSYPLQVNVNPKDAYIAYLQDRATKGVNIGDITCSTSSHVLDQPSQLQNVLMAQPEADEPTDEYQGHIEPALNRVEARNDLSLLYPPVSLASNSQKQINSLSAGIKLPEEVDLFTDEVKKIVQEDCNIIYECKTCSNLFRSLANLVKHKRLYCKENSNNAAQLELNRRSTMNTIQTLDMSVTKNSRESVISRPVINKDHEESKNSLLVDSRPRQSVVPPVSNGSQKYNLRGKRVDVSCLTGDSRASRAARNQDKLRDNRGQGSPNSSRNYPDNLNPNSGQTNLSRLLQSQPKNRVGAMKDSALMDALNIGPALSVGDGRNIVGNTSICKLNEQLVRNSSLAKTLLSENVKSINESQPNFEIPNADSNTVTGQKPITTPKRKFLEDCIRKVKRDKLVPDDGCGPDSTPIENQEAPEAISHDESDQYRDPLDIDDSGADSDVLVMDIDESYLPPNRKKASNEKISPNRSQTRSATSFLQATSRLNSSSALLKALTRPVEPKPTYPTSSNQKIEVDKHSQSSNSVDDRATATDDRATTTDDVKSDNSTGNLPDKVENAEEVEKQDDQPPEEPVTQPLSPIMDKFSCESCSTEYPDHQTLFEHIINDHKTLKKIHPCIFCSLSFITLENVCRHIIDIHKKTKTQVGRLKDVVESRSFYSSDFTACTDLPASCKDEEKDRTETDRTKNVTPEALSDLAATEQILNDTVALVSMASSPNKAATTMSPWERPETSSTSNTSSVSGSLIESSSSDGTDSDSDSSDTNNSQRADVDDDNEIEANDQIEECDSKADDDYEEEAGDDPLTICVTPTKRKTSSCGSASKRETDLNSSEIGDKISKQEYNDDASPHISSKSSSRSSVANTPDGSGSCKLKLKTASLSSSSSSREVGGANSGASTSSGGAPTSGSGSSGIMKLKIQLKTQPDEKSKVYRIVE